MAVPSRVLPEVFASTYRAAAAMVHDFNAQTFANMRAAMARLSRVRPEIFDSLGK